MFEQSYPKVYEKFTEELEKKFKDLKFYDNNKDVMSPSTKFPCVIMKNINIRRELFLNSATVFHMDIGISFAERAPFDKSKKANIDLLKWFGSFVDEYDTKVWEIENDENGVYKLLGDTTDYGGSLITHDDSTYIIQVLSFIYTLEQYKPR